ncbi:MAG: L-threonylcarbamoyladenylate synthase [Puniceicoccales bacterium]
MTTFLATDTDGINRAAQHIQAGECVAVPTETVYGLAGDAFNEAAVRKIFSIKGRPLIDPLIVHFDNLSKIGRLAKLNEAQTNALQLVADAFWPGPLTVVVPKQATVPDLVTANRDSVAIRCPKHPAMRRLIATSARFLAAPSANPFGYISPTTAQHVADSLGERCPYILDGGPCEAGLESTIIDLRDPLQPRLLRPGPIGIEQLSQVLNRPILPAHSAADNKDVSLAPGQLERHYSPQKPLTLYKTGNLPTQADLNSATVYLARPKQTQTSKFTYWLSEKGDPREVAQNLFGLLRALDEERSVEAIHCELPNAGGLADAIRDRLIRASKR